MNGNDALTSLQMWNATANGDPGAAITIVTDVAQIGTVDFAEYGMMYVPSCFPETIGGITDLQLSALNERTADIATYVNDLGGGVLALTESGAPNGWDWLPIPIEILGLGPGQEGACPTMELEALAPNVTCDNLDDGPYHDSFPGPPGYYGLTVLATMDTEPFDPVIIGMIDGPFSTDLDGDGVPTECECRGDLDGDCNVGFTDLNIVLNGWGPCPGPPDPCPGDIDEDGNVGFTDLNVVLGDWGACADCVPTGAAMSGGGGIGGGGLAEAGLLGSAPGGLD